MKRSGLVFTHKNALRLGIYDSIDGTIDDGLEIVDCIEQRSIVDVRPFMTMIRASLRYEHERLRTIVWGIKRDVACNTQCNV